MGKKDILSTTREFHVANQPALEAERVHCQDQIRYWQARMKAVDATLAANDHLHGEASQPPPPSSPHVVGPMSEMVLAAFGNDPTLELSLDDLVQRVGLSRAQTRSAVGGLKKAGKLQKLGGGLYRVPADAPVKRRPAAA